MGTATPSPTPRRGSLLVLIVAALVAVLCAPALMFMALGVVFALASFGKDPGGAFVTLLVMGAVALVCVAGIIWGVLTVIRELSRFLRGAAALATGAKSQR